MTWELCREFIEGSHLVGSCEPRGLWPKKFSTAMMTVDELFSTASKEGDAHSHFHSGIGDYDVHLEVRKQTLKEVESGALTGPADLADIPKSFPLSRRFGVQQGPKIRCVDDFTRPYRQYAVNPSSTPFSHIAVFDPLSNKTSAFRMKALPCSPFGNVNPHSFLRVAHTAYGRHWSRSSLFRGQATSMTS